MDAVGGQALIEGVMIKAGKQLGVAIRDPEGKIIVTSEKLTLPFTKIPFLRGIVNLIFLLYIGTKKLYYSTQIAEGETDGKETSPLFLIGTLLISVVFAVFLFKFVPLLSAEGLRSLFDFSYITYNIVDGLVKILLFILYIVLVGRMADMQRVFAYHGAEHKAVNCYEAKKPLTLQNLRSFSRIHDRCGTNFIFLVLFLSIIMYTFIPETSSFWWKLGLRLLLLPIVSSLSYELLRLAAKFKIFDVFVWPGKMMQRITTREPDDSQLEVAVAALKAALKTK